MSSGSTSFVRPPPHGVHYLYMKKETLIGIVVILVALCGIVLYASMKPSPAKAPSVVDTSGLPAGSYVEHADYYDIATNYATSTPLTSVSAAADAAAVASIKSFISDTITQFKTDGNFANLTPADVQTMGLGEGRKETLEIKYLISTSPRTVSYIFTTYEDTLGAHPNTTFKTFTFDTTSGKELALADLFTAGSDYLGTLSTISRAQLPAVIGDAATSDSTFATNFIDPGTTPDAKNFENFFLDNQTLVVLFPPYSVAPYSSGPQTLYIPIADLTNVLKAEYQ